jgi:hypothetical protein
MRRDLFRGCVVFTNGFMFRARSKSARAVSDLLGFSLGLSTIYIASRFDVFCRFRFSLFLLLHIGSFPVPNVVWILKTLARLQNSAHAMAFPFSSHLAVFPHIPGHG